MVYPGAFAPIHRGHLAALSVAIQKVSPQVVDVCPVFGQTDVATLTSGLDDGLSSALRDFCRVAEHGDVGGWPKFSGIMRRYIRLNPRAELFLLLGGNHVEDVVRWPTRLPITLVTARIEQSAPAYRQALQLARDFDYKVVSLSHRPISKVTTERVHWALQQQNVKLTPYLPVSVAEYMVNR